MANNNVYELRDSLSPGPLSEFNPARYFSRVEFVDPSAPYSDIEKEEFIQLLFFCDYLTLHVKNPDREKFSLPENTSFFATIRTNFKTLEGWDEVEEVATQGFVYYSDLMKFFFRFYKPRAPEFKALS